MRILFLLSSFLTTFLFSYVSLYDIKNDFIIEKTGNIYKLILKKQQYINYKQIDGFKFFIPKYTKEFSLKILRFNSTGKINGLLSMNINFNKLVEPTNFLKFYTTNYKNNGRELDYLLKGYTVPYKNVTALSFDCYNIPQNVYNKLNKFIYFKRIPLNNNSLKYILYSCYIILDKKSIDNLYPKAKEPIKLFLQNIYNLKKQSLYKHISKKHKNKTKKMPYRLNLYRLYYMKGYGYIFKNNEIKININLEKFENEKLNIINKIEDLKFSLKNKFDNYIVLSPKKIINEKSKDFDEIENLISKLDINYSIKQNNCIFDNENINKKCFKNPIYFHNYITYLIKNNKQLNNDSIIAFGNYKTLNDVGVYYFENSNFQTAEIFLKKAYILAQDKSIPAHNLGILYITYNPLQNTKKAIKYFKLANLPIDNYNLGVMYYIGLGVKESDKIAREYFKKAKDKIPLANKNFQIMKQYKIGIK